MFVIRAPTHPSALRLPATSTPSPVRNGKPAALRRHSSHRSCARPLVVQRRSAGRRGHGRHTRDQGGIPAVLHSHASPPPLARALCPLAVSASCFSPHRPCAGDERGNACAAPSGRRQTRARGIVEKGERRRERRTRKRKKVRGGQRHTMQFRFFPFPGETRREKAAASYRHGVATLPAPLLMISATRKGEEGGRENEAREGNNRANQTSSLAASSLSPCPSHASVYAQRCPWYASRCAQSCAGRAAADARHSPLT